MGLGLFPWGFCAMGLVVQSGLLDPNDMVKSLYLGEAVDL